MPVAHVDYNRKTMRLGGAISMSLRTKRYGDDRAGCITLVRQLYI